MSDWVYDLETYPNIFSMVAANGETKKMWVFEISYRKDDSKALRKFLTQLYKNKDRMVGFNNLGFDYPLIHHFLKNKGVTCDELYRKAMEIIDSMRDDKFANTIREKDILIPQIDLYKIHHFDNSSKATSLKMIEYNMRSKTIEDLPFNVGKVLTFDEMDTLLEYNQHDVIKTYEFYLETKGAIEMRELLSEEFGMNCINYNDTRIGKEFFVQQLEKAMPQSCYKVDRFGKRTIQQTKRDELDLSGIIFPYVKFERPEFQAVLNWVKRQRITETKGVFSDIEEHLLGDVAKYARLTEKTLKLKQYGKLATGTQERKDKMKELREELKQDFPDEQKVIELQNLIHGTPKQSDIDSLLEEHPMGWVERKELKSGISFNFKWRIAETLSVFIDGIDIVFGLGGIHASVEGSTFESDDEYVIIDYDVASMYPNLFISNRVYPAHLSEKFCDIYKDVYMKRKSYPKGSPQNAVMKLALNGTYGATNDKFSPFYDPLATMTITINGQMSLCMLGEQLLKFEGLKLIQFNTDGLTVYAKRKDMEAIDKVVKEWDKTTGLEMERAVYQKMAIRDVNNYIAVYEDGKYKRNGQYEYKIGHIDGEGLGFHQNQSALIVKRAAFEKIVNDIPVEMTIKKCKDPFDFCLRTKVPRSSRLVTVSSEGFETLQQNICRYYISKEGEKLVKIMPPLPTDPEEKERRLGIDTSWFVKTCNNINQFKWDVDYDYYISEAKKLVDGVGEVWSHECNL